MTDEDKATAVQFRKLIVVIAEKLRGSEIATISGKFVITKSYSSTALDLLSHLLDRGKLSHSNTGLLSQLLRDIERQDLVQEVNAFEDDRKFLMIQLLHYLKIIYR